MSQYIGIDLGTSAIKLLLMDADGKIRNTITKEYPLEFPQSGWSQQNPEDWRKSLMEGIPELLDSFDAGQVTTGVVGEGGCNISLGTSGTVFISSEKFGVDDTNALHPSILLYQYTTGEIRLLSILIIENVTRMWIL